MAAMKKGTSTGKTDAGYNEIGVGDKLRNIHTGIVGYVNKYGQITTDFNNVRDWNGNDWAVIEMYQPEVEDSIDEEPVEARIEVKDEEVENAVKAVDEVRAEEQKEEEKPQLRLYDFPEEMVLDELRRRGFHGTITKTYTVTETVTL